MPQTISSKSNPEKSYELTTTLTESIWKQMIVKSICAQLDLNYEALSSKEVKTYIQDGQIILVVRLNP